MHPNGVSRPSDFKAATVRLSVLLSENGAPGRILADTWTFEASMAISYLTGAKVVRDPRFPLGLNPVRTGGDLVLPSRAWCKWRDSRPHRPA